MKKFVSLFLAFVMAIGILTAVPLKPAGLLVVANAEETTQPEITEPAESFLTYKLSEDGKSYIVTGYTGEAVDEIIIPAQHEGKPVAKIGDDSFYFNTKIKKITLPNCITEIGYQAFANSSLEEITIPDSVTVIGPYCFFSCDKLKSVTLPKTIKAIEAQMFIWCSSLKEIVIPDGVTRIGSEAFRLCGSLEKVTIPDTVTEIGSDAFSNCSKLKSITIPGKVKEIAYQTFMDCSSLEEVVINNGTKTLGYNAFKNCTSLNKVTLPDSVERIYDTAFENTKIFNDKANWEDGVLYIGNYIIAADNTLPEMYRVKDGTVGIAERAFYNATNTASIFLPKSIKLIDRQAFWGMPLAFIFYEGTVDDFKKIKFTDGESELENTIVILEADGKGVPAKVSVKGVTNVAGGVQISWNAVDNADIYLVWRRGTGNSEWTLLGITDQTTVVDTSPVHRQYWRYSIQAMNFDEVSEFDYTGKYLKYVATPKLTGISNATNGIYFKWNAVSGASGYRVYRRAAGAKYWTYLGTVKTTSYTDKAVKNASGNYYRYTVRAVVDGLYSGYEDFLYTKRLANPTLKSATSGNGGITVKWSAIKGTTGYYVYRKTSNSNWVRIGAVGGTNNTTFVDKTAKSGTTYTYTVRAVYGKTTSYFNSGISCKRK